MISPTGNGRSDLTRRANGNNRDEKFGILGFWQTEEKEEDAEDTREEVLRIFSPFLPERNPTNLGRRMSSAMRLSLARWRPPMDQKRSPMGSILSSGLLSGEDWNETEKR